MRRRVLTRRSLIVCGALLSLAVAGARTQPPASKYRIETASSQPESVAQRFSNTQLALLEKLNRADLDALDRLPYLVVPVSWDAPELSHTVLPGQHPAAASEPKLLIVYLPGQVFGAYEWGVLVRWGPVSSGSADSPTAAGFYHLNWRSPGHTSTVDPDWFMRWYFNFGNREGLAFHEYALPGLPASHGCIRLLERDAQWLFEWGEGWTLDEHGVRILKQGTPVSIVGEYDFNATPPWRSLTWLGRNVDLAALHLRDPEGTILR